MNEQTDKQDIAIAYIKCPLLQLGLNNSVLFFLDMQKTPQFQGDVACTSGESTSCNGNIIVVVLL